MTNRLDETLANAIVSDLAYWVGRCVAIAALRMTGGFGAALSSSAAMRAEGSDAHAIALALAETADRLRQVEDAQHAGWLLLSIKVELMHLATSVHDSGGLARGAAALSREVEEIARLLVRRGTEALTSTA